MEQLLAKHAGTIHGFTKGRKIQATFIRIERSAAYFDIGGKSEAYVTGSYFAEAKDFIKTLKAGQKVSAVVMDSEDREGRTVLSLKHAAADMFWKVMKNAFDNNELVTVTAKNITDRGVAVELSGNSAFIPFSQLKPETAQKIQDMESFKFKVSVLEVDQPKGRIVLSERAIADAENMKAVQKILEKLTIGQVLSGTVTTVTSFGAFVEVMIDENPVEGLVHVSELSWGGKVSHPSDVLTEGDTVSVAVVGSTAGKLALSLKRAVEDPWLVAAENYHVDDRLKGKVTRVSDFGLFVELSPGIEGLIHMTKIPPSTKISVGEEVSVVVEEINIAERKIGLGLVITSSKPVGYK